MAKIVLADLPVIAKRIEDLRDDHPDRDEYEAELLKFISRVDTAVCDWEFTARHFLMMQAEFDKLEEISEESWGHQTTQGFLKILTHLDDLGPEGEKARAHFSKFSAIAEMARHFVITEEG